MQQCDNQSSVWNQALLQNGARPSGALVIKPSEGAVNYLTKEQFTRLQDQLNEKFMGGINAGRPLLLEGGLEWQEMSYSPKDMDFIEAKNSAARDIALAFGVPPQLLGIKGDNTYSNMQEARFAFWEETIVPLVDRTVDALNNWLIQYFGNKFKLAYDTSNISALSSKQEKLWQRIQNAEFMTTNEKRAAVGLAPIKKAL
jgi:HK97 family phage portal protein